MPARRPPAQPTKGEPIRLLKTKTGEPQRNKAGELRYRVTIDAGTSKDGKRRQVSRFFGTLTEARKWLDETRSARGRNELVIPDRITLSDLVEDWLSQRQRDVDGSDLRQVSHSGYRPALSGPLMHAGAWKVQEITLADVRALVRLLSSEGGRWGRPLSHRSITYSLVALRQVFDYAIERELIRDNPAARARAPKAKPGEKRPRVVWTVTQLAAFREHVDGLEAATLEADPWLPAAMRLSISGLRRSEVLGLTWSDVDLEAKTIRITKSRVKTGVGRRTAHGAAKTDESIRTVPVEVLHAGTVAALRALWMRQGQPVDGLVVVDVLGEAVDPDRYSRAFRALAAEAGLPDIRSIHNLRHTVAVALHGAGVPPREAASLLGHALATHIAFYLPNDDDAAARAAEVAGRLFAAAQ